MSTLCDSSHVVETGKNPVQGVDNGVICTAADGVTEVFNIPGRQLLVSAVSFNRLYGQYLTLQEKFEELQKKVSGT